MSIIFDLDQTLIDSVIAEPLRNARRWDQVYAMIEQLRPYDGINQLIEGIVANDIPVCIVTSSPRSYCSRVVKHWEWKIDKLVCYHDTIRRKPAPDPILKGIEQMNTKISETLVIGDDVKDIKAAKSAGAISVAVLWGASDIDALIKEKPDITCNSVDDLIDLIENKFKITIRTVNI